MIKTREKVKSNNSKEVVFKDVSVQKTKDGVELHAIIDGVRVCTNVVVLGDKIHVFFNASFFFFL